MSSFAFSHQFSQRWLATPSSIKQTITQELADIVTLLQSDTQLEDFKFRVSDLNEAVESLMVVERARIQAEQEAAEQLAKEQAEREEQERLEQQRLEQDQAEIALLQNERALAKQANADVKLPKPTHSITLAQPKEMVYAIANPDISLPAESLPFDSDTKDKPVILADNTQSMDIANPSTPETIVDIKQQIIEQLQVHLEKYLQDIQQDLNHWLHDEVARQINEHLAAKSKPNA